MKSTWAGHANQTVPTAGPTLEITSRAGMEEATPTPTVPAGAFSIVELLDIILDYLPWIACGGAVILLGGGLFAWWRIRSAAGGKE
ncbi:MAG: hypothetical protein AB1345_08065 [Chloroflexota bacterium]